MGLRRVGGEGTQGSGRWVGLVARGRCGAHGEWPRDVWEKNRKQLRKTFARRRNSGDICEMAVPCMESRGRVGDIGLIRPRKLRSYDWTLGPGSYQMNVESIPRSS